MILICNSKELLAAMELVKPAIDSMPAIPAVGGFYFKSIKGYIHLIAANNEIWMEVKTGIECDEIDIVVPFLFYDLLKQIPSTAIEMRFTNLKLVLRWGNSENKFSCELGKDFILKPTIQQTDNLTLECDNFKTSTKKALFFCNRQTNDFLKLSSSVYFDLKGNKLSIVATDRQKIGIENITVENEGEVNFLIHSVAISKLLGFLPDTGNLKISTTKNHVSFETDDLFCSLTKVRGKYYPYQKLIHGSFSSSCTFDRKDMISALSRAMVISNKENIARIIFAETITIPVITADNSGTEIIESELNGEGWENGYRMKDLKSTLESLEEEQVTIQGNITERSIIFIEEEKSIRALFPFIAPSGEVTGKSAKKPKSIERLVKGNKFGVA